MSYYKILKKEMLFKELAVSANLEYNLMEEGKVVAEELFILMFLKKRNYIYF